MSEDIIRYDILVQNALRAVIHKALSEVQRTGLPGNHHFFITFDTNAPGVRISKRLKEQYVEQMTIVLQHQYRDLDVTEHGFSVGLSFSDIPEMLYVPYGAIRGFYDPSVNFELEFDVEVGEDEDDAAANAVRLVEEGGEAGETVAEFKSEAGNADTEKSSENDDASGEETADVVSLDSFRKKK
ncbi:MAG: SspB family protein [Pseudomonadota bacterium]